MLTLISNWKSRGPFGPESGPPTVQNPDTPSKAKAIYFKGQIILVMAKTQTLYYARQWQAVRLPFLIWKELVRLLQNIDVYSICNCAQFHDEFNTRHRFGMK